VEKYSKKAEQDCNNIKAKLIEIHKNDYFGAIIERGEDYFKSGKVRNLRKINDDTYEAEVAGSETYKVTVKMNGRYCYKSECTCPFNTVDPGYINPKLCKHIYATNKEIYELENKEFLNYIIPAYLEQYNDDFVRLKNDINNLELNIESKNIKKEKLKEFQKLYEQYKNILGEYQEVKVIAESFYDFLKSTGTIFDILNELIESNKKNKNLDNECKEEILTEKNTKKEKSKKKLSFWKILETIFSGIGSENSSTDDTSAKKDDIDYGDTVYVNYSGKIGVVVDKIGDSYTVKLKNEDEQREYYETYKREEISPYY